MDHVKESITEISVSPKHDYYLESDVEQPDTTLSDIIKRLGLRLDDDGYIRWRPDSPDHPRNWSAYRKSFDTTLIFTLDLFTYVLG